MSGRGVPPAGEGIQYSTALVPLAPVVIVDVCSSVKLRHEVATGHEPAQDPVSVSPVKADLLFSQLMEPIPVPRLSFTASQRDGGLEAFTDAVGKLILRTGSSRRNSGVLALLLGPADGGCTGRCGNGSESRRFWRSGLRSANVLICRAHLRSA